jgi:hypothetical protein
VLLGITFLANLRQQQSRKRAHQLVLAGAYFDEAGRVMVTPQGLLPAQRITNSYVEKVGCFPPVTSVPMTLTHFRRLAMAGLLILIPLSYGPFAPAITGQR